MPARAFFVFGHMSEWELKKIVDVLMPARAFFVFGLIVEGEIALCAECVLMPARAFFVFGPILRRCIVLEKFGSNAREGIFCFWTLDDVR